MMSIEFFFAFMTLINFLTYFGYYEGPIACSFLTIVSMSQMLKIVCLLARSTYCCKKGMPNGSSPCFWLSSSDH